MLSANFKPKRTAVASRGSLATARLSCYLLAYQQESRAIARKPRDATTSDVAAWMSASRLRLNPAKTEVLWLGSKYQVVRIAIHHVPVLSTSVKVANTAHDLGVIIDRSLTMSDHVAAVCRAAYFQLRQLCLITRSLTADAAKLLVQAFIACRLDYCNSLFCGISDSLFQRLQSVQNAAARVITGTSRCDHITPVLRQLHWLPVRQRVQFKLAVSRAHLQVPSWPHGAISDRRLSTGRQLRSPHAGYGRLT